MTTESPRLRADARRNVEGIRAAALDVFRTQGLNCPLDEVARAAGVSKGTIYHRFGGRQGLIDAVVEDLVAERIRGIIAAATEVPDPVERFETYLRQIWLLQYDEPAANDVLLRALPGSAPVAALCEHASTMAAGFLAEAQAAGGIREDLTPDDVYLLIWERGIIARACDQQPREGYRRRLEFTLRGLRTTT
ncbi:TetR/AcrR family transcriptional regulator [Promicromonospora thailandica]|uniref:Transcriptional regulator, TetR family n=1 Tax=Promicromonospora thailandica TaxID=765201 RepID=A0A9X2G7C5_9MICO|nr:TetR/AcrR family transcriptional regulator [Promicromonospora thailandica]MCP2264579.1 transcriptional regulator, TetR family [Promicromonospora thailandica]BFF20353.1 TetR/AcrR family transcriptional regulator [Promicromonospora thailandica]